VRRLAALSVVIVCAVLGGVVVLPTVGADPSSSCTDSSRACVISAARAYIDALVSHDGTKVPFAPAARRTENGMVTATSGAAIANDLSTNQGDRAIYAARDIRWFVDGDQAIAYYLLDTAMPGSSAPHTTTVHLSERFKVDGGLIYEIEAIFWVSPGATPDGDCWSSPC